MSSGSRELVLVSAGLDETGGGAAALGRMVAWAMARWAEWNGHSFEIFHLGSAEGVPELPDVPIRHFDGSPIRLALALARAQAARPGLRLVFDHPGPARVQGWLPGFLRRPYLVWLLGVEVWKPLRGDRFRALERARARLAISETTARRAAVANSWLPGFAVVHLGHLPVAVGARHAVPSPETGGTPEEGHGMPCPYPLGDDLSAPFLMVGRMDPDERYKGHDEVLEAFSAVVARVPGARLVIAGGGADRARLEHKVRDFGLGDAVTFVGYLSPEALSELYGDCAALVLPSAGEGFGLVYLEAMAAGRPVVALAGGAAAEIVVSGETGWLVPPRDSQALTDALVELLTDPQEAERRGAAGRRRYEERFTFEAFEERLGGWLARLVA